MTDEGLEPRVLSSMLGVLAVLEGQARAGQLPLDLELRLGQRLLRSAGTTGTTGTAGSVRGVDLADELDALNQHLRTHERGAGSDAAPDVASLVNVLTFPSEADAAAFVEEMQQQGKDVDPPRHETDLLRWTVVVHHRDRADAPVGMEYAAAAAHGGRHLGAF